MAGNGRKKPQPKRQPRRRQQNAGQRIQRAPMRIPKGLPKGHHFDAFKPSPQALGFSIGPATPVSGLARFPLTLNAALPSHQTMTVLFFQPCGGLNQLGKATIDIDSTSGTPVTSVNDFSYIQIDSTGFTSTPGPGSPKDAMCTRGSLRLRNTSPAGQMGGAVHFLRSASTFAWNSVSLLEIQEMILQHVRSHTYSGSSLSQTHQWDLVPVAQDEYTKFVTIANGSGHMGNVPGLTTLFIAFAHTTVQQSYEVSIAANYYARYDEVGPLANAAMCPPTAPISTINRVRDAAEALVSAGRPLAEIGGRAAVNAIPGMLGNLLRQNARYPALALAA